MLNRTPITAILLSTALAVPACDDAAKKADKVTDELDKATDKAGKRLDKVARDQATWLRASAEQTKELGEGDVEKVEAAATRMAECVVKLGTDAVGD